MPRKIFCSLLNISVSQFCTELYTYLHLENTSATFHIWVVIYINEASDTALQAGLVHELGVDSVIITSPEYCTAGFTEQSGIVHGQTYYLSFPYRCRKIRNLSCCVTLQNNLLSWCQSTRQYHISWGRTINQWTSPLYC